MKPRWIENLPMKDYHWGKYRRYLNNSALKELERSPAHLKAYWEQEHSVGTKQQQLGTLVHGYCLNQEVGKQEIPSLKKDDIELASVIARAIISHPLVHKMLSTGKTEVSGFFPDPDFGFSGKIRADILCPELGLIADIKTTQDASPARFKRDIRFFKYYRSAWWYLRGANTIESGTYNHFLLIAAEKKEPYGVVVYRVGDGWLYQAEEELYPLLKLYAECLRADSWPSYPEGIIEI